jgi:16S rRNA G966 N2-methylase RsmD
MPDAGRVIAGRARGLRLAVAGPATRPLADRVKQTLFAILERDLPGTAVLDLFAGTGAAGIEALSRGAARTVFVERDPVAIRAIRENLRRARFAVQGAGASPAAADGRPTPDRRRRAEARRTVDVRGTADARPAADETGPPASALPSGGTAEVVQADVIGWLRSRAGAAGPFSVAIVDPPYAEAGLLASSLTLLGAPDAGILASGARVVAKHFWREPPPERIGLLASERSRRFGETALTFYRLGPGDGRAEPSGEPDAAGSPEGEA